MCFILYGVTEAAGFSGAIAAISFGVVLANGRRFAAASHLLRPGRFAAFPAREHGFQKEIIFVLKTFFFVYLGISMRFDNTAALVIGAAIVSMVYAARHVLAALLNGPEQAGGRNRADRRDGTKGLGRGRVGRLAAPIWHGGW